MNTFKDFYKDRNYPEMDIGDISDDVEIACTNFSGFAGRWTVGLRSQALNSGRVLYGTRPSKSWSYNRGRGGKPSRVCMEEMVAFAKSIGYQPQHRRNEK